MPNHDLPFVNETYSLRGAIRCICSHLTVEFYLIHQVGKYSAKYLSVRFAHYTFTWSWGQYVAFLKRILRLPKICEKGYVFIHPNASL